MVVSNRFFISRSYVIVVIYKSTDQWTKVATAMPSGIPQHRLKLFRDSCFFPSYFRYTDLECLWTNTATAMPSELTNGRR